MATATITEAAAAAINNKDRDVTAALFGRVLKIADHSAAASGSTPIVNFLPVTAVFNSAKVSNGKFVIRAMPGQSVTSSS